VSLGHDAALLSLGALRDADNRAMLEHCCHIADVIPIVGFYLQDDSNCLESQAFSG